MKRIILCADDYGQNEAISQAIIELLSDKRLSAVSCLVSSKHWPRAAEKLKTYTNQVDIGLHFNLTFEKPYSLMQLLFRCYAGMISKQWVSAELNIQLDRFMEELKREPDFIDGHQHVHAFPRIRDILVDVYEKRGLRCYIRSISNENLFKTKIDTLSLKRWFIHKNLGRAFENRLVLSKIPHNSTFSGIYDFSLLSYRDLFTNFVAEVTDVGLIMCHPGLQTSQDDDEIKAARFQEWSYFSSDSFQKDCETQNISLIRFSNNKK